MIRKLGIKFSVITLIALNIVALIYHLIIITELIPYNEVWGGRLETREQMFQFETVSIVINSIILIVVLVKGEYLKLKIPSKFMNILLWIFVILFALNTLGNIFAESIWEAIIFTPVTLISSILFCRLAIDKQAPAL